MVGALERETIGGLKLWMEETSGGACEHTFSSVSGRQSLGGGNPWRGNHSSVHLTFAEVRGGGGPRPARCMYVQVDAKASHKYEPLWQRQMQV